MQIGSAAVELAKTEPSVQLVPCPGCGDDTGLLGHDTTTTTYRPLKVNGAVQEYGEYESGISAKVRDAYDIDAAYDDVLSYSCVSCGWEGDLPHA